MPVIVKQLTERRVFHTLDALRGIAAIGVVIFHMGGVFPIFAVSGGYLAVDLFFMMSGVVLCQAYDHRLAGGMSALEFMKLRLIRLFPLYLLGLALGIAVTLASMSGRNSLGWSASSLVQSALLALFFLPNLSGKPIHQLFPLNIPCWSLFLELLVNLLFAVLWRLTLRSMIVISVVAGVGLAVAALHFGTMDLGSTPSTLTAGAVRTVFGFSTGVVIGRLIGGRRRFRSSLIALIVIAVFCAAISLSPGAARRPITDLACVLLIFPLLVWLATLIDPGTTWQKASTFLGLTSYAVYVLHTPLLAVLSSLARVHGAGVGLAWLGVAFLMLLLAVSWLIDSYYDAPVRRYLSRRLARATGAAARS